MLKPATICVLIAACLAACSDDLPEVEPRVRAIKAMTVTEPASGAIRQFNGVVEATDTSVLSFAVGGTVASVDAGLGDKVSAGQVLARLDDATYKLDVEAAQSELASARAVREEKRLNLERQTTLYEKQWVSQAALDQARSAYESAASQVEVASARVDRARRDLAKTVLRAPFDGVIAAKDVDPFVEVKSGQTIFEINAQGALEVAVSIPESVIGHFSLGMPVTVDLTNVEGCGCSGRVTEIGSVAGTGNSFPLKVALLSPPAEARSGMTATASFTIQEGSGAAAYLIPVIALAPGAEEGTGYVFTYNADTSTVRKSAVQIETAVRGNWIAVSQGVEAGDIIAIAGVSMLSDGQKVTLLGR